MTHAELLCSYLRGRRWWTWGDLLALRISNSPWKRLMSEGGLQKHLKRGEKFERKEGPDGLLRMRIVKVNG